MNRENRLLLLLLCVALAIVTAAIYWPVLKNGFINYDDPDYVTANEVVQKGITGEGIKWAFTSGHASNWHPLTWLSHMLDVSLFGMKPMGHHLTNLLFHCANTVLLLLLLRQMTGAVWRSALVAALFALHPLHVESVAWVAERKDVLSAFFGILTLMAYAKYASQSKVQSPKSKVWYGVALLTFACGLMSKPMLVTWPFVMLLLDFWPLKRVTSDSWRVTGKVWRALALEKSPFLLLSILSSIVTTLIQRGAMAQTEVVPLSDRFCNAIIAYADYLKQTFLPVRMAVFYPYPISFQPMELIIAVAILAAVFVLVTRTLRSYPFVMVGWLWYLGTLVPVIGLVQVGAQARADRYTYLPLIGIFIAISWSLPLLFVWRAGIKQVGLAAVIAALVALSITSHSQLKHWRDDRSLCAHAAAVTEGNYMAWGGLGIADVKASNWSSAMTNLTLAYEYAKPRRTERSVGYYLGVALQMQNKPLEALPYLEQSIVSDEMRPERDHRLGLSLIEAGRLTEAEAAIRSAIAAKPRNLNYLLAMAALYDAKKDMANAEAIRREAVTAHPDSALAAKSYGDFLMFNHREPEAVPQYEMAVKLKPTDSSYLKLYANALRHTGKLKLGAEQYEAAFKLTPPTAQELQSLAEMYLQLDQTQNAVDCYNKAIATEPNSVVTLNDFAWLLATHHDAQFRNGARAVELGERACKLTEWKVPVLIGTLAAAYAEAGDFQAAIATAERATKLAESLGLQETVTRNRELIELYRQGKAAHGGEPKRN